uniref:60S ribosomal protein L2, mitochondrial n=2 Tax=Ginkgo biloba TaxID=3311 RepID=A0A0N7ASH7_GINBI|nr:ribosomal protein L2 [Ginkgo biloba]AJP33478.1 ribosomal protein L2 [Ginkgo biloba]QXE43950.1 ribosomal protein L2 [Ginkgo biloba]
MRKSCLQGKALRQFTFSTEKSAGRNPSGRTTVFHRGGGSKRLQRRIDSKRSTSPMGIVERIECDPNRPSRIALVRWIEGVLLRRQRRTCCNTREEFAPPREILEPTTATIGGLFSFSSLPGRVDEMKDVFLPALSSPGARREAATSPSSGSSLGLPRIAVAGAKPASSAPRMREELRGIKTFSLCEVRRWGTHSVLRAHRIKRRAALSRQSYWRQETLRLVEAAEHNESRPKADQGPKDGACKVDRAPVTHISAGHQSGAGKMVTNCDWSKPSTSFNGGGYHQPAHNSIAHTDPRFQDLVRTANEGRVEGRGGSQQAASWPRPQYAAYRYDILDPHYQVGNCIPSANIRIGTWVHNIECNPGQGAKPTRAAGTFAKTMKKPAPQCLVRSPPGVEKLVDPRCRATIGIVPNPNHGARKLGRAGQSRWLGRRPIVRGVAMNPVDHPHGGGEGRTKGGRPSVSPWGEPTKAGFRTVVGKRRNQ